MAAVARAAVAYLSGVPCVASEGKSRFPFSAGSRVGFARFKLRCGVLITCLYSIYSLFDLAEVSRVGGFVHGRIFPSVANVLAISAARIRPFHAYIIAVRYRECGSRFVLAARCGPPHHVHPWATYGAHLP
jgi:hypothetical protein